MELYSRVRIRQLLEPPESDRYDGWNVNQRPPRVGEVGFLIDVLHATGHPDGFVVECSGPDGVDISLGTFLLEELETVPDGP